MSLLDKTSFSTNQPPAPRPERASSSREQTPASKIVHPDHSVFGGKSWITEKKLVNDLGKKYRGQVRHHIGSTDPKKIKEAVSRLQETVQEGHYGHTITPHSAKKIIDYAHHEEHLHTREKAKDGFTSEELKEVKKERGLIEFLARKFGLKRDHR